MFLELLHLTGTHRRAAMCMRVVVLEWTLLNLAVSASEQILPWLLLATQHSNVQPSILYYLQLNSPMF